MSMDICSHIDLSATDNKNDFHGVCVNAHECTHGGRKVLSVNELGNNVTKFLHIQETKIEDSSSSPPPESCELLLKDACNKSNDNKVTTQAFEKSLSKSATFPFSGKTMSPQDTITSESSTNSDNVKSLNPSGLYSTSMPTRLKPISAMKGSREKRGDTPPEKLIVKWASDVYDPIPTSVSHVVTNNRSSRHSKKSSRNKQKSGSKSSSRSSKGKDKKQVRKRGGNSSRMGYKLPEFDEEVVVDFREHELNKPGVIDFRVGNPDQLCGSSFLKRYGTSLHLSSVAEAT